MLNTLLFYPAIFHTAEEGGYWVSFPDIPECLTEGDDITQAYEMAADALGLCITDRLNNKEPLPAPSKPEDLKLDKDEYTVIVQFNHMDYIKKHNSKAVKKTLSIPEWLNEEAIAKNINFSQVLQEALIAKLS